MGIQIKNNTTSLQNLLDQVNNLPEVSNGVELPELTNPATEAEVLSGREAIDANGNKITGSMANNGAVSKQLDTTTTNYTIPQGYHNGSGKVSIATETKTVAPTTSQQTVTPASGKVLSSVTVSAMPTATQATPSINVDANGLITASSTQSAGYVSSGTKSATKQLTTKGATTITPSTSAQTAVASGVYTTGTITVGAMPTATQATPSVSVSSSGLITASATQSAGYVSAGTKSGTKQLTTQAAKTITPTKSEQVAVGSGIYTTGVVKVGAIPNEYITTTDATASSDEIFEGETAYTNGSKVTGTFTIDSELSSLDTLLETLETSLEGKASGGGNELGTCTITVTLGGVGDIDIYTTILENGEIKPKYESSDNVQSLTVNNVLCGALIYIYQKYTPVPLFNISENIQRYSSSVYDPKFYCNVKGAVETIHVIDDM